MKQYFKSRVRIISLFIFVFAIVLIARLYMVQIISHQDYLDRAARQYIKSSSNFFDRGTIFFQLKDGSLVSAATLKTGFVLAINPEILNNEKIDLEDLYNKLNKITPLDKVTFLEKARKDKDPYEELAKKLALNQAEAVQALKINGVSVYSMKWRFYPGNSMAAHTLGFVAYKGNDLAGRYGLESYYEKTLARDSSDVYVNFFAEIFSDIKKTISPNESLEGDIVTTIEPSVEAYLEDEIKKINEKWSSTYTAGIIINPMNGEIYAMAVDPTFDPNNFQAEKSSKIFSDPLVENRYEMGSVIKALTMAAGLDSGAVTAKTTYDDTGCVTMDKKTFCNYDRKARGITNMQTVLDQSLNVGAAAVVKKMGNQNFAKYMYDFGLGEETGIDLPNEGISLVSNLKSKHDIEYATASFGQGIAMTPITTVRAFSALANGGTLIYPHLVKKINYKIGTSKTISFPEGRRVIKKETSDEITRMLVRVVDEALLGGTARLTNYSVAAKTGTAQMAKEDGTGYYDDRYLHSFFGYFPAYNPKFLVFLYTVYPKDIQYASETLARPFLDITKFLINYYEIPPDREMPSNETKKIETGNNSVLKPQ